MSTKFYIDTERQSFIIQPESLTVGDLINIILFNIAFSSVSANTIISISHEGDTLALNTVKNVDDLAGFALDLSTQEMLDFFAAKDDNYICNMNIKIEDQDNDNTLLNDMIGITNNPEIADNTIILNGATLNRGNIAEDTSSVLTITGGIGATIGNVTIQVKAASTSQSGYLSSTDWNTFNGKQNALGFTPEDSANKASDFTIVNNTLYPSIQAVKDYADSLVVGLIDDRGNYDASVDTFPASGGSGTAGAILKGDLWFISVAGTLGGVDVAIGDQIRALADTPGQTASNWAISEANIGYVSENSANKVISISAASTNIQYASAKCVYDQLALKVNTSLTINSQALTGNITLTTADIADSANKRYLTDAQRTIATQAASITVAGYVSITTQMFKGVKTFDSFPISPSSAPTEDYQVANKKYVDDNSSTTNVCFITAPEYNESLECVVFPLDDVNAVLKTERVPSIANLKANVISANSSFTGNVVIYPTAGRTELTQAGWTASSVTGAYYRAAAPGSEPTFATEDISMLKKVADTASLVAGTWCWDDGDTLGFDTLYVFPNTGNTPTTDGDGFYQYDTVSSQTVAVGAAEAERTITISSSTPLSVELWRDTNDASDTLVDGSSVPVSVYFTTLEFNK